MVLNNKTIDGIVTNFLNSVLLNRAKIIIHTWDGFKKNKKSIS